MPDSIGVQLADAVVTELNDTTFSEQFTATRSYAPVFDLKTLNVTHVTVVPGTVKQEIVTRSKQSEDTHEVSIAVERVINVKDLITSDAVAELLQEINDHFKGEITIAGSDLNTRIMKVTMTPPDWDHLTSKNLFLALVTLTVFVFR